MKKEYIYVLVALIVGYVLFKTLNKKEKFKIDTIGTTDALPMYGGYFPDMNIPFINKRVNISNSLPLRKQPFYGGIKEYQAKM